MSRARAACSAASSQRPPQSSIHESSQSTCALEELVALLPLSILAFEHGACRVDAAGVEEHPRDEDVRLPQQARVAGCGREIARARRVLPASPRRPPCRRATSSCTSALKRRTSSPRRSASSSATRVPSSAAAKPFLKRSAQARRMWMSAWSAGCDDASRRASARTRNGEVVVLELGEEEESLGAQRAALVPASRSVAIDRARVHSPAARCARAAASARRWRSSRPFGGVSRSACSASSAAAAAAPRSPASAGGVVEHSGNIGVRRVRRQREVTGTQQRVVDELRDPCVHGSAARRPESS